MGPGNANPRHSIPELAAIGKIPIEPERSACNRIDKQKVITTRLREAIRMKRGKHLLLMLLVAVAILGMSSCTWLLAELNYIEIDGERYDLSDAELWYFDQVDGVYLHYLVFTSDNMDVSEVTWANGSGQVMLIGLGLPGRALEAGEYDYSPTLSAYAWGFGLLETGATYINESLQSADYQAELDGGSFSVAETLLGDFVFDFDLNGYDYESSQAVDVVGRYRGPVDAIDASGLFDMRSMLNLR